MNVEDLVIASVDGHIVEPSHMYDQHLSVRHKTFAPELRRDKNGVEFWLHEGRRTDAIGLNAVVGRVKEEYLGASRYHSLTCARAPETWTLGLKT